MNTYDQELKIAFAIEVTLIFSKLQGHQQVVECGMIGACRMKSLVSDCWLYLLYHTTCSKYLKILQTVANNGATQYFYYILVLVRTHPVFSNWKSRILRHHNWKIFKTQKTPDMFFARVFSPPPLSPNMIRIVSPFTLHPESWRGAWVAKSPVCHEVSRTWQKAAKVSWVLSNGQLTWSLGSPPSLKFLK